MKMTVSYLNMLLYMITLYIRVVEIRLKDRPKEIKFFSRHLTLDFNINMVFISLGLQFFIVDFQKSR